MLVQPAVDSTRAKIVGNASSNVLAIRSHDAYANEPLQNAVPLSVHPVPIPSSFLGLSMEYWELPQVYGARGAFSRLVNMLKVPGGGPSVLRIGGDSADTTAWVPPGQTPPPWVVSPVNPQWLRQTSRVLTRTGMRTIIDLNGLAHDQQAAAVWAQQAERGLPQGTIEAFEIGNEPNLYNTFFGEPLASDPATQAALDQYYSWGAQQPYTVNTYLQQWQAYEAALQQVVPGVPLAGPATDRPTTTLWANSLLNTPNTNLGVLTTHIYPLSACATPGSRFYPNNEQSLLSPLANARTTAALMPFAQAAHAHGVRAVVTEANSITCGGIPGESSSFATALWAANTMFDLADSGVDAVNVHVRLERNNPAFVINGNQISARPLMYGLAFFSRALTPDATITPLTAIKAPASNPGAVHTWLLKTGTGYRVVIVNDNDHTVRVRIKIPDEGILQKQLLQGANLSAQTATLAGQSISPDGTWTGTPLTTPVSYNDKARAYVITVPAYTASLSIPSGH
jgi:hypothetical protein